MARTASQEITVPWPADMPVMTITQGTGADSFKASAVVDNHGNGPGTIDWGDGTGTSANPGDGTTATEHTYTKAGTYNVCFTDDDRPSLKVCKEITVTDPPPPMTILVVEDTTDATGYSVIATVDNKGQGPVKINWGDGTAESDNPGDNTTQSKHAYATKPSDPTTYTVTATDPDTP